jgi:hypothetical protein
MPNPFDKYLPKDLVTDSSPLSLTDACTAHKRLAEITEKRRKIEQARAAIDQRIQAEKEKGIELDRKTQEIQSEINQILGDE